jgi:hypothetical protein
MQRKFEGGETVGRVYDWVDGEAKIPINTSLLILYQ